MRVVLEHASFSQLPNSGISKEWLGVHKQWGRGDTQGARRALSSGSMAITRRALSQTKPSVILSTRLGKLKEREILAVLVD